MLRTVMCKPPAALRSLPELVPEPRSQRLAALSSQRPPSIAATHDFCSYAMSLIFSNAAMVTDTHVALIFSLLCVLARRSSQSERVPGLRHVLQRPCSPRARRHLVRIALGRGIFETDCRTDIKEIAFRYRCALSSLLTVPWKGLASHCCGFSDKDVAAGLACELMIPDGDLQVAHLGTGRRAPAESCILGVLGHTPVGACRHSWLVSCTVDGVYTDQLCICIAAAATNIDPVSSGSTVTGTWFNSCIDGNL